jgi:hypothetical protein
MATPKAVIELQTRLTALEAEVAQLKQKVNQNGSAEKSWLDELYGAFADDPDFLEAMRLGREYRESLRPKTAKRTTKRKRK